MCGSRKRKYHTQVRAHILNIIMGRHNFVVFFTDGVYTTWAAIGKNIHGIKNLWKDVRKTLNVSKLDNISVLPVIIFVVGVLVSFRIKTGSRYYSFISLMCLHFTFSQVYLGSRSICLLEILFACYVC